MCSVFLLFKVIINNPMQIKSKLSEIATIVLHQALEAEINVSYLYRHISLQCQRRGLFGAAKFFAEESTDELAHAKLIENYFNDRCDVAKLPTIEQPDTEITSLYDALNAGFEAELNLGEKYASWYQTILPKDPTTAQFLFQFIEIQRVSVGEYSDWLQRLSMIDGDKCGVLMIDKELGT